MSDKREIKTTLLFRNFFEDVNYDCVFLLSLEESSKIWETRIDKNSNSYFQLSNDNWLIKSNHFTIGKWLEDYNLNYSQKVKVLLEESIVWNADDIVWFCINKITILESKWGSFTNHWINFLTCEDDSPILINSTKMESAIIFRSIGSFIKTAPPALSDLQSESYA